MGLYILLKSFRDRAAASRPPARWTPPLGFVAGFLDASGGGGWGPVVTSTLIGSGHAPRQTVGSVNTTEFFVTVAAATTFFVELGASPLQYLRAAGARRDAWRRRSAAGRSSDVPARGLMVAVGFV